MTTLDAAVFRRHMDTGRFPSWRVVTVPGEPSLFRIDNNDMQPSLFELIFEDPQRVVDN
jgi:hypothetical protein